MSRGLRTTQTPGTPGGGASIWTAAIIGLATVDGGGGAVRVEDSGWIRLRPASLK